MSKRTRTHRVREKRGGMDDDNDDDDERIKTNKIGWTEK